MNYADYLNNQFNLEIKNQKIVNQALIHPSYANEINNIDYHYERLEFIGDAILQFLVSDFIYRNFPKIDEGAMTVLRAKAVREDSLAKFALEYNLSEYIKVGKGEKKSGGTQKKSVLANVFEAMIGAIYLSNGLKDTSKFITIVFESIKNGSFEDLEDYKTKLQEYVQADSKRTIIYELIETSGSANEPTFKFKVLMDDIVLGYGSGSSKKRAQQNAAKDALQKMVKNI